MKPSALLGLRTVVYHVADLERAKSWYRALLGIDPYFDSPYYVGFNVGGFELGLHPPGDGAKREGVGGAITYWGVDDIARAHERLLAQGAEALEPVQEVGEGIKVAAVKDPFGNALGIIENRHFPNTA